MIRKICWVLLFAVLTTERAFAWGAEGHMVVGSIADQLLNENAKKQVAHFLGFELRVAAPWLDCVRSVERGKDQQFLYKFNAKFDTYCKSFFGKDEMARMVDYVSRNWSQCPYGRKDKDGNDTECHKAFHFADVAIQHDKYSRDFHGTGPFDVVSAISAAIAKLQGSAGTNEQKPDIKDEKEALFLLAHLVGDLHQPLHVGAIYLDAAGQPVNPDDGNFSPTTETRGGNSILKNGGGNLHSEWDGIPSRFGTTGSAALVQEAGQVPATGVAIDQLAATWASDTVLRAREAFNGLSFTPTGKKWTVEGDFRSAENNLKEGQLVKGGAHLAELLNAIWP